MLGTWMLLSTLGGVALLTAPAMAAQVQQNPDQLLEQIKANAQTIEMHATTLAKLTRDTNTRWGQFDEQWNQIKPAQEELQMKLNRLEGMRATLTDQQRKELDQSKTAVEEISAHTHRLLRLIDKPGMDLTSPQFRAEAGTLAKDAATVVSAS